MRAVFSIAALLLGGLMSFATVVNLGNTPWKFTKVVSRESNLAAGKDVMCGSKRVAELNDGNSQSVWRGNGEWLEIDLLAVHELDEIELQFPGDSVQCATVEADFSTDGTRWTQLSASATRQSCISNYENDITTVNGTVGYASVVVSTSCKIAVGTSCRYVRVRPVELASASGTPLRLHVSELLIHPHSVSFPPSYYYSNDVDDTAWDEVGLPHCYNEQDTYLNATTGERCWRGEAWYRKHLFMPLSHKGKRVLISFESVNIGATVYINGNPIEGNTQVPQPGAVTHVGSSLPFVVDITDHLHWGDDNVLAVRVSNGKNTFFTWP